MRTPVQRNEAHTVRRENGRISRLGQELKKSQELDSRWHANNSWDTRNLKHDIGDAVYARNKLKADLSKRLSSLSSSPRDKQHAHDTLREIQKAETRERNDRIIGRQGSYTSKDLRTDRQGILRIKY